jgi:hypothetical protein
MLPAITFFQPQNTLDICSDICQVYSPNKLMYRNFYYLLKKIVFLWPPALAALWNVEDSVCTLARMVLWNTAIMLGRYNPC